MMMMIAQLLLVPGADSFSTMAPSPRPRPTSIRMAPDAAAAAAAAAGHGRRGAQLVWFTGSADLRVGDHGGLLDAIAAAAAADAAVVPVFVIDPAVHLRCRPPPFQPGRLARPPFFKTRPPDFQQAAWPGHFSKPFCFFNFHGKLLLHSPDLQLKPFLSPYSTPGGN
jgi:hypothetical protein